MKNLMLISIFFFSLSAFAGPNFMTNFEKQKACRAIMEYLDYDSGLSVPLCVSGKWVIHDIEDDHSNRQVAFDWEGKISKHQGGNDRCDGYVYSYTNGKGKIITNVIDLRCKSIYLF